MPAYEWLGIRPDDVGEYSPAEIDIMMGVAVRVWKRDQNLADLRAARICSVLTSTNDKPHPPKEFMIDYDKTEKPAKRQTPEEMAAILKGMTMASGGKIHG